MMKVLTALAIMVVPIFLFGQPSQPKTAPIRATRLENDVNANSAELAPVRYGDRVYFSSVRPDGQTGTATGRIFSFIPGGKATPAPELNFKKSNKHLSGMAFLPDASRMYITVCGDDAQTDCEIWSRERDYAGGWGAATKLPAPINMRGSAASQPSIGWDEGAKQFVLFFVSDRAGGKGGKDIWAAKITWDGQFEPPVSLPFNTAADDVSPFFDRSSQALFFSSNGLGGLGRLDIFKTKKQANGQWAAPTALSRPFNSAYDDLYCSYHEPSGTFYLVSDRPGSQCKGSVEGLGCYDIYEIAPGSGPGQRAVAAPLAKPGE